MLEEVELFQRAVVLIGVFGSGLSNQIFCKPGTAVVELPVLPFWPSSFGRLASSLGLPYYVVPSVRSSHFHSIGPYNEQQLADVTNTVNQALDDLGYYYW